MDRYNHLLNPTIERLKRVFHNQHKADFSFVSRSELDLSSNTGLREELLKGKPLFCGDDVLMPIFLRGSLAGAGKLTRAASLLEDQLRYLHQVMRMMIESSLMNIDRLDTLELLENHLKSIETKKTNVVRIKDYQETGYEVENKFRKLTAALNFPCLIESVRPEDIFKMSLEIHEFSCRYAFIPLSDLAKDVFETPEKMKSLGPVSIFIEDIMSVDLGLQKKFIQFLDSKRDRLSPQFIVGTTAPYSELKKSPLISSEFLSKITIGYLYMSEPFNVYKSENIVEFFFDSLTGRQGLTEENRRPYV